MLAKQFKVIWTDWNGAVRGRPSRDIAIRPDATLYDLAAAALSSFDFDMDHAFGFYDNLKNWARATQGYELFADMGEGDQFPGVKRTKAAKVFPAPKQKMLLLFDYGDEWRFIVQFIKDVELPAAAGNKLPVVLASTGKAPDQYGGWEDDEEEEGED